MLKDILVVVLFTLPSAVISYIKFTITSLNYNKVSLKAEEKCKKSIFLKKILDRQNRFLTASSLIVFIIGAFLGVYIASFNFFVFWLGVAAVLNLILVKLFSVIAGSVKKNNDSFEEHVTEEEIKMMLEVPLGSTDIDEEERQMIKNVFEFDDKTVEEICTHRKDIIAIDIDDEINDILKEIAKSKYSRIPVYKENIDNIVGILNIRDIMKYMLETSTLSIEKDFNLRDMLLSPTRVSPSKKADELFKDMKKNKTHIAIIIDEYGGTVGLVTMEDLVEAIMGNISDEYDDEEKPDIKSIVEGVYEVLGTALLSELSDKLNISLPVDEYDTVSGFLIGLLGRIPAESEKPQLEFEGFVFDIKQIEDKRITDVLVTKKED